MTIYRRKTTIFINMDNAVRRSRFNKSHIIGPSDIELVPGRKPIMVSLQKHGYNVIGLSHQVDLGDKRNFAPEDLISGFNKTNQLLGPGKFDNIYWSSMVCKYSTDVRVITHAVHDLGLRSRNCLIVGQVATDYDLAVQLRFDFVWASKFFNHVVPVISS
jgi:hypothetical protein